MSNKRPLDKTLFIISFSRVFLAVIFIFTFDLNNISKIYMSLLIILIAQLSDNLDGLIARKFSEPTFDGYLVDATCDKLFQIAVIVSVFREYKMSVVLLWALIAREVIILTRRISMDSTYEKIKSERAFSLIYALLIRSAILVFFTIAPVLTVNVFESVYIILAKIMMYSALLSSVFLFSRQFLNKSS